MHVSSAATINSLVYKVTNSTATHNTVM